MGEKSKREVYKYIAFHEAKNCTAITHNSLTFLHLSTNTFVMARSYAFYFIVVLMVISVYLAEFSRVKIDAACGGFCRPSTSPCTDRRCSRCIFDSISLTYSCRAP
ncbi:hypothetical protein K7X08_004676 [Anisodus acutangulus]|uniref:Uncharacterized protein n=1 Tax=Anisodus acutangulus TaxID=402998 RepID=A0A9Q1RIR1_9SOLA|nr:hypothetical protein K7X08_004676 [Anisodus acutangulus]